MSFNKKDCERVVEIYESISDRGRLTKEDVDFESSFTIGDLIVHCGLKLEDANRFTNFLKLESRRHARVGLEVNKQKIDESRKVFIAECNHMCRAAGISDVEVGKGISFENTGPGEQAGMIKSNLQSIASKSQSLHDRIGDMDELPEWVQEIIAVADEMIDTISDYLNYEYSKVR